MSAVFFDIDGTLWDEALFIPESTRQAIQLLRKNGHQTLICSGRTKGYIRSKELLSLGFDGIVSGAGNRIELNGQVVFYRGLSREQIRRGMDAVQKYRYYPILEGDEYLYLHEPDFAGNPYLAKMQGELGPYLLPLMAHWDQWDICKMTALGRPDADPEGLQNALKDDYGIMCHNPFLMELVPKGVDKGEGLKRACQMLGVPIEESVAFGDSMNDLQMIRAAGMGVVMGNGDERLKQEADLVTSPLWQDGIMVACHTLGLI